MLSTKETGSIGHRDRDLDPGAGHPCDGATHRAARQAERVDNGSELTSSAFTEWCEAQGIELLFIQPGKLDQNAFIERFNRTYREEVLDAYVFESIEQVRDVTENWLREYNEERQRDSLGRVPPLMFMPRRKSPAESTYQLCP